jgi:hypothetical protein
MWFASDYFSSLMGEIDFLRVIKSRNHDLSCAGSLNPDKYTRKGANIETNLAFENYETVAEKRTRETN